MVPPGKVCRNDSRRTHQGMFVFHKTLAKKNEGDIACVKYILYMYYIMYMYIFTDLYDGQVASRQVAQTECRQEAKNDRRNNR